MRLWPVLTGPVHSCVGAAGRFPAVCCVKGGGVPRDKPIIIKHVRMVRREKRWW